MSAWLCHQHSCSGTVWLSSVSTELGCSTAMDCLWKQRKQRSRSPPVEIHRLFPQWFFVMRSIHLTVQNAVFLFQLPIGYGRGWRESAFGFGLFHRPLLQMHWKVRSTQASQIHPNEIAMATKFRWSQWMLKSLPFCEMVPSKAPSATRYASISLWNSLTTDPPFNETHATWKLYEKHKLPPSYNSNNGALSEDNSKNDCWEWSSSERKDETYSDHRAVFLIGSFESHNGTTSPLDAKIDLSSEEE